MRYEYSGSARVTFVNPPFHTDKGLDPRTVAVRLLINTDEQINPGPYHDALAAALEQMQGSLWLAVDDPYILKSLEPKTGNTVHAFLDRLRAQFTTYWTYVRLGGTVPPDTINGYVLYVLPPGNKPTLEAVGAVIAKSLAAANETHAVQIEVSDGKLTVRGTPEEFVQ